MALLDEDLLILLFRIVVQVSSDELIRRKYIKSQLNTLSDAEKENLTLNLNCNDFGTLISNLSGCTKYQNKKQTRKE